MKTLIELAKEADYAYATIKEYEELAGFSVPEAFRAGWNMARTTNSMLGIKAEPVKQEPVAWRIGNEICVRADWTSLIEHESYVDVGRAIPDSWVPLLYAAPVGVDAKELRDNMHTRTDVKSKVDDSLSKFAL